MNKYIEFIRNKLDPRTIHEQLAEECNELAKASLKVNRAFKFNDNTTPVKPSVALNNVVEEAYDVMCLLNLLGMDVKNMANNINHYSKYKRWAERLGYKE